MRHVPSLWRDLDQGFFPTVSALRPIFKEFDQIFEGMNRNDKTQGQFFAPACDIEEEDNRFLISVDMPGMDKDKIDIELNGSELKISGERQSTTEDKNRKVVERRYGRFERVIALPEGVKAEDVDAQYKDGVLTVAVQKPEITKSTKIKLNEGKGVLKNFLGDKKKESNGGTKDGNVAINS